MSLNLVFDQMRLDATGCKQVKNNANLFRQKLRNRAYFGPIFLITFPEVVKEYS